MNRPSNLPPGETDNTLGLNDKSYEYTIELTSNEINTLMQYNYQQSKIPYSERSEIWHIVDSIVNQLVEEREVVSALDDYTKIRRKKKLDDEERR